MEVDVKYIDDDKLLEIFARGVAQAIQATRDAGLPVYAMKDGKTITVFDNKSRREFTRIAEDRGGGRRTESRPISTKSAGHHDCKYGNDGCCSVCGLHRPPPHR